MRGRFVDQGKLFSYISPETGFRNSTRYARSGNWYARS